MNFFDVIEDFIIEEENAIGLLQSNVRKQRVVKLRPNHFSEWDDNEFRRRFRLEKDTVKYLLSLIKSKIEHKTKRNQCVSPLSQLLIALRFYATGSFYISVGDFAGVNTSTVCGIIKRVTSAIASLRVKFVKMPRNNDEILAVQEAFYQLARFPRVVGAIDCTHVRIISPGGDTAENFRNRKGYFSINVQALCSANLKIQDIVARWPGSTHDSLIFANSAIKYRFDNGNFRNGILLGDGGYFNNDYLATPFNDPQTNVERLYNESQIRTRNTIERCFGVWKRRFPVLSIGMRCRLPLVQQIITATAILHNMAIEKGEDEPPTDPEVNISNNEDEPDLNQPNHTNNNGAAREMILEYFSSIISQ